jgi:hypothetical protein
MVFQAYVLDEWGNALLTFELQCATQEAAEERARQLIDEHPVELWQGSRLIAVHARNWRLGTFRISQPTFAIAVSRPSLPISQ